MISTEQALTRLKEGNSRFINNQTNQQASQYSTDRQGLVEGQAPFAIILGCADSRVPPELIFDQGLGDLFVIRVAGNVADTAVIGSIEYAAEHLGTPLLVVLGHESCGAVKASIGEINQPSGALSPDLTAVVEMISEGIRPLIQNPSTNDEKSLEDSAIKQNVRHGISQLKEKSTLLNSYSESGKIKIVGAKYMLQSGKVEFLD